MGETAVVLLAARQLITPQIPEEEQGDCYDSGHNRGVAATVAALLGIDSGQADTVLACLRSVALAANEHQMAQMVARELVRLSTTQTER